MIESKHVQMPEGSHVYNITTAPVVLPVVITISVVTMVAVITTISAVFYSINTRQLVSQLPYLYGVL